MKNENRLNFAFLLPAMTLVACLAVSTVTHAQLYRWTDDTGKVHYGDSLPPERAPDGRRVFTPRGDTVEDIPPVPTLEQQRALEEARQAAKEERSRQDNERRRRQEYDRMLVMTYISSDQIENTRDERIARLETLIQSSRVRQERFKQDIKRLEEQAIRAERSGSGNTGAIYDRLRHTQDRLAAEEDYMENQKSQTIAIEEEFTGYINRFEELNATR